MNTTQNSTKSKIVKVIGVDLAKDHCDVIGYDENGKICLRLDGCSYAKLREILSNLPQAVVLMEACKGSMFHARSIADLGHEVRLVKGADVKALRNINHKNDLRDAAYIAKLYFVPRTSTLKVNSSSPCSFCRTSIRAFRSCAFKQAIRSTRDSKSSDVPSENLRSSLRPAWWHILKSMPSLFLRT